MVLVDAHQFPAPAFWQGLMLIVCCVWAVWMFSDIDAGKPMRNSLVFLGVATALVSVLTWWVFG